MRTGNHYFSDNKFRAFSAAKLVARLFLLLLMLEQGFTIARAADAVTASTASTNSAAPMFVLLINGGRSALGRGQGAEALTAARAAIQEDPKRFEGYALAALACQKKGDLPGATEYVDEALARAPEAKKARLVQIKQSLSNTNDTVVTGLKAVRTPLSEDAKVKLRVLELIAQDADRKDAPEEEHRKYLKEYLEKSSDFLQSNTNYLSVWIVRTAMAIELNDAQTAWEAGKRVKELTAGKSDPGSITVMAMLERKGWTGDSAPSLSAQTEVPTQNPDGQRSGESLEPQVQDLKKALTEVAEVLKTHKTSIEGQDAQIADIKKALTEVAEVLKTHKTSIEELNAAVRK